ncbi:hypothetical protein H0H92_009241 [Tricholoma furcatifolium]|nr:hypothetical protein H0H92_009241 [Tricholoma furcatifolium]
MAHLIRLGKSGSDWDQGDLTAYKFTVLRCAPISFFKPVKPTLPSKVKLDHIDQAILNASPDDPNVSAGSCDYFDALDLAIRGNQESFIDSFAAKNLKLSGFDAERYNHIASRYIIPLSMCGESRFAQTNVCMIQRQHFIVLVLGENKTHGSLKHVEPQLIAEAIAAFQYNNKTCRAHSLPVLDSAIMPCICMIGLVPSFFLVPVTTQLSDCIATGAGPSRETIVWQCKIMEKDGSNTGMEDARFRKRAVKYFHAFEELARHYWTPFLEGF